MAYPRSEEFEGRQLSLAKSARALSHPGRLAILEVLANRNTCYCGELVVELPLAQATVSQHLKVLKEAGFIKGIIEGPRTCYCIDWAAVVAVREAFETWFREIGDAAEAAKPTSDWSAAWEGDNATSGSKIKDVVRERYKRAAEHDDGCGCGCGCGDSEYNPEFSFVGEDYRTKEGYEKDADLGLGCGVPTDLAGIREGHTVLDLGSGAGIDAFMSRKQTGETGRVIGVDFTKEMVRKARKNATKLGYENVEFIEGDIESLPIEDHSIDVVISNCVLNLVPDKPKAFEEIYRVIRPGGHFCISDIVIQGQLPERFRESAALYAGCITGAIGKDDYLNLLRETGFSEVKVVKERIIRLPDDLMLQVATPDEVEEFKNNGAIVSVTVTGVRDA